MIHGSRYVGVPLCSTSSSKIHCVDSIMYRPKSSLTLLWSETLGQRLTRKRWISIDSKRVSFGGISKDSSDIRNLRYLSLLLRRTVKVHTLSPRISRDPPGPILLYRITCYIGTTTLYLSGYRLLYLGGYTYLLGLNYYIIVIVITIDG